MWYVIVAIIIVALIIWYIVQKKSANKVEVNPLEKYLNQEAVVTETISDTIGTGKVEIDGQEYQARRGGPGIIKAGTKVIITAVGNKEVTVKPAE